ncbi:MAG: hypothetical protein SFZ02_00750 [bacterium]|nr:hypothetical protein [bacterium]
MSLNAWLLRVILGVALFFGNDILLWQNPTSRAIPESGLLLIGYIAISAIMLDLAVRYRVNDVYLTMLMVCIGALLIGLLLNPTFMLVDFPRHLLTRVIGASAFVSMEMWGLFLALMGGHIKRYRRLLVGFSLAVGFNWGVWARYAYQLKDWSNAPAEFGAMVLFGVIFLGFIGGGILLWKYRYQPSDTPLMLRMNIIEWCVMGIILTVLFMLQGFANIYDGAEIIVTGILIGVCWLGLWAGRPAKGKMLLDAHFPPVIPKISWLIASLGVFTIGTLLGFGLPLVVIGGFTQLYLLELAFAGVGFLWLPIVAGVLAVRGIEQQSRKLDIM